MKKNMSIIDGIIRSAIAATLVILYFTEVISGTVAIIGLVVAVIFVATSTVRFCPIYRIFGMSTCAVKE